MDTAPVSTHQHLRHFSITTGDSGADTGLRSSSSLAQHEMATWIRALAWVQDLHLHTLFLNKSSPLSDMPRDGGERLLELILEHPRIKRLTISGFVVKDSMAKLIVESAQELEHLGFNISGRELVGDPRHNA